MNHINKLSGSEKVNKDYLFQFDRERDTGHVDESLICGTDIQRARGSGQWEDDDGMIIGHCKLYVHNLTEGERFEWMGMNLIYYRWQYYWNWTRNINVMN